MIKYFKNNLQWFVGLMKGAAAGWILSTFFHKAPGSHLVTSDLAVPIALFFAAELIERYVKLKNALDYTDLAKSAGKIVPMSNGGQIHAWRRISGELLMGVGIFLAVLAPSRLHDWHIGAAVFAGTFMVAIGGLIRRRPSVRKNPELFDQTSADHAPRP